MQGPFPPHNSTYIFDSPYLSHVRTPCLNATTLMPFQGETLNYAPVTMNQIPPIKRHRTRVVRIPAPTLSAPLTGESLDPSLSVPLPVLLLHCPHLCLLLCSLRGQELGRLEGTEIRTSQTFVGLPHSHHPKLNCRISARHRLSHQFPHYVDS